MFDFKMHVMFEILNKIKKIPDTSEYLFIKLLILEIFSKYENKLLYLKNKF